MFSGFEIEVGKSQNAFLIAHIVESCIIQSINQSWRGQFCRLSRALQYAIYACGIFERELKSIFGILLLKFEIRFALSLSTGYKAKLKPRLQKTLPAVVSLTSFVKPNPVPNAIVDSQKGKKQPLSGFEYTN